MAGPVEHMHPRLDGLYDLYILLHGLRNEVMMIHHGAVAAYLGHGSPHAPVQIYHPHRHLDSHQPSYPGSSLIGLHALYVCQALTCCCYLPELILVAPKLMPEEDHSH